MPWRRHWRWRRQSTQRQRLPVMPKQWRAEAQRVHRRRDRAAAGAERCLLERLDRRKRRRLLRLLCRQLCGRGGIKPSPHVVELRERVERVGCVPATQRHVGLRGSAAVVQQEQLRVGGEEQLSERGGAAVREGWK
eukprot:355077-Chlamydomonas_euryale.AAC.12